MFGHLSKFEMSVNSKKIQNLVNSNSGKNPKKKREVHITPLNSSPSLIYNLQLQNRLICNLQLLKPAKIQPSPPLDRFWPGLTHWLMNSKFGKKWKFRKIKF